MGRKITQGREEVWRDLLAKKIDLDQAARLVHLSKNSARSSFKSWKDTKERQARKSMEASKPFAPAPAPAPVPAPQVQLPKSLAELLADGPPAPSLFDALSPSGESGDGSPFPGEPSPKPLDDSPSPDQAPRQEDIDYAAARLGKSLVLKIRGGIVRGLLRYYAGVNPNDPEIQAFFPKGMVEAGGPKSSFLETVLDENPEKTQRFGKIFRGWLGILAGTVLETFDISGTVRQVAEKQGAAGPTVAPGPTLAGAPPVQPGPAAPAPQQHQQKKGFDLGMALMNMNAAKGK